MSDQSWEEAFRELTEDPYIEFDDLTSFIRSTIRSEVKKALEGVRVEKEKILNSGSLFHDGYEDGWNSCVDAVEEAKKGVIEKYG